MNTAPNISISTTLLALCALLLGTILGCNNSSKTPLKNSTVAPPTTSSTAPSSTKPTQKDVQNGKNTIPQRETFPLRSFTALDGTKISIESLKGKIVIIDYWATYCEPCKELFPLLEELYQQKKNSGLEIIAVSLDEDPHRVRAFLKNHPVSFTIAHDPQESSLEPPLSIKRLPAEIILDRNGDIAYRHDGVETEHFSDIKNLVDNLLASKH